MNNDEKERVGTCSNTEPNSRDQGFTIEDDSGEQDVRAYTMESTEESISFEEEVDLTPQVEVTVESPQEQEQVAQPQEAGISQGNPMPMTQGQPMSKKDMKKAQKEAEKARKKAEKEQKTQQKKASKGSKPPKQPKQPKDPSKKMSKGKKIGITIGAVILIGGIAFFVGTRDKEDYYTVWNRILSNELGSFRFSIDVRSGEHGDKDVAKASKDALKDNKGDSEKNKLESSKPIEEQNEEIQETPITEEHTELSDWTDADGITEGIWTHPNYQLVVEGCTTNNNPLTTTMDITMVTENFNAKLTSVTVINDKVYIDVEQIQYWLKNSADAYFISLSNLLPENSKYLIMPLDEVKMVSGYAEEGEHSKGYESNLLNAYRRFVYVVTNGLDAVHSKVGGKGLSGSDGTYSLEYTGKNADKFSGALRNIVTSRSSMYDSLVNAQAKKGLLDEEQMKQKVREKDNFLAATDELERAVHTTDYSKMNMVVKGNARTYTGGKGNTNLEATMQATFTVDKTDYSVTVSGLRSGNIKEISIPKGSNSKVDQQVVYDTLTGMFGYMDILGVDLKKQLEVTPESLSYNTLEDFANMVNETKATKSKITALSAQSFIDKYKDYQEDETTTEDDIINAQLVSDFLNSVNEITGGAKGKDNDDGSIDRFRTVESNIGDVKVIAKYNDADSNTRLGVVDIVFLNDSDKEQTINLKDLSLQTMLSSKYPINDETTIRDYDNNFDLSLLHGEIKLSPKGFAQETCYVILNNGLEYMDLFYGDEKLGDIIAR